MCGKRLVSACALVLLLPGLVHGQSSKETIVQKLTGLQLILEQAKQEIETSRISILGLQKKISDLEAQSLASEKKYSEKLQSIEQSLRESREQLEKSGEILKEQEARYNQLLTDWGKLSRWLKVYKLILIVLGIAVPVSFGLGRL